jgi:hypothetical protein
MTPRLQQAAARRDGAEQCRGAFDLARLDLGGKRVQTLHQVKSLAATSSVRGDRAEVRLQRGGATMRFALVRANAAERIEFAPPNTEWRIAGGVLPLIPVQRS